MNSGSNRSERHLKNSCNLLITHLIHEIEGHRHSIILGEIVDRLFDLLDGNPICKFFSRVFASVMESGSLRMVVKEKIGRIVDIDRLAPRRLSPRLEERIGQNP